MDSIAGEGRQFVCPACGYDGLPVEPWLEDSPSDEICPSCGIQFGYDDAVDNPHDRQHIYEGWRRKWGTEGCQWFSDSTPPPANWDPEQQLLRVRNT